MILHHAKNGRFYNGDLKNSRSKNENKGSFRQIL